MKRVLLYIFYSSKFIIDIYLFSGDKGQVET